MHIRPAFVGVPDGCRISSLVAKSSRQLYQRSRVHISILDSSRCHKVCAHRQWFWKVFMSPSCDFHYRIVSVFNAVPPVSPKITAIQQWLCPLCTLVSLDSLNPLMILCTVLWQNPQILYNFTMKNIFPQLLCYLPTVFHRAVNYSLP